MGNSICMHTYKHVNVFFKLSCEKPLLFFFFFENSLNQKQLIDCECHHSGEWQVDMVLGRTDYTIIQSSKQWHGRRSKRWLTEHRCWVYFRFMISLILCHDASYWWDKKNIHFLFFLDYKTKWIYHYIFRTLKPNKKNSLNTECIFNRLSCAVCSNYYFNMAACSVT